MKLTGTLKHVAMAGGAWIVAGDDGKKYQLLEVPSDAVDGARVEVEGEVAKDVMTFQMAGRPFRATSLRRL